MITKQFNVYGSLHIKKKLPLENLCNVYREYCSTQNFLLFTEHFVLFKVLLNVQSTLTFTKILLCTQDIAQINAGWFIKYFITDNNISVYKIPQQSTLLQSDFSFYKVHMSIILLYCSQRSCHSQRASFLKRSGTLWSFPTMSSDCLLSLGKTFTKE